MNFNKIKDFFNNTELTDDIIDLDGCTVITNLTTFVNSHIKALESNPNNKTFMPYYDRLLKLYKLYNT